MNKISTKPKRGRPPKVAREKQDTKAVLIRSGLEQLTEQGFSASGIDQVLKKVGVPKGSFYHYFASKEAFGLEIINSYAKYFANKLDSHLLNKDVTPLARIGNFVDDAKQGMVRHNYQRGCLIGNLEQEITLLPVAYREQLLSIYAHWQSKIALCLADAKEQNSIAAHQNTEQLAENFWIGWEGAISRARLTKSTKPLDDFYQFFIAAISK